MGPMAKRKVPEDARVDALHGYLPINDDLSLGQSRHCAQLMLYVADCCQNLLDSIEEIKLPRPDIDRSDSEYLAIEKRRSDAIHEFKTEMNRLKTLINDKPFLRSLDFLAARQ
jgi:hypothetical protein